MTNQSEEGFYKLVYEAMIRAQMEAKIRQAILNLMTDIKAHTADPKVMETIDTFRSAFDRVHQQLVAEETKRFRGYGNMPRSAE